MGWRMKERGSIYKRPERLCPSKLRVHIIHHHHLPQLQPPAQLASSTQPIRVLLRCQHVHQSSSSVTLSRPQNSTHLACPGKQVAPAHRDLLASK
ncbi:hypothetical protein PCANC_19151 [Puccinia coronata f. sp. avenae]|uniref:Uncharacterized protein n=1 Tax=Puccinia coronata f. sp. avenae TaxID=200324 RepID=A0A2N5TSW1_9BASI|nr:hypothetical protein PCANC_19151 [Puccinia coronata f. sp. avenae]